eukprot:2118843-Prymnesium_polylepis.2
MYCTPTGGGSRGSERGSGLGSEWGCEVVRCADPYPGLVVSSIHFLGLLDLKPKQVNDERARTAEQEGAVFPLEVVRGSVRLEDFDGDAGTRRDAKHATKRAFAQKEHLVARVVSADARDDARGRRRARVRRAELHAGDRVRHATGKALSKQCVAGRRSLRLPHSNTHL